jgi:alkylation response protein AidB-like acyl-CoA dehydrogenase
MVRMDDEFGWVPRAQRVADDVLFPAASSVERSGQVPAAHLDLLADEGFYGVAAPPEYGGVGPAGFPIVADVVAALAGGCLTTAFVWLQHLAPLMAVAGVAGERERTAWLRPLAAGRVRAGLAMARPDLIHVRRVPGGYRLSGESPWVTGWGLVDVLLVGAVDDRGLLHFFMVDAAGSGSLVAHDSQLLAVQASRTVSLRFADHFVPADRLGHTQPLDTFVASQAAGTVMNGFLALGLAGRCARLLGDPSDIEADIADARLRLLTATPDEVPQARATSSLLAARAAARLVVHTGSRSVLADQHAGRLYRESGFLLVFGLRPPIKHAMLERLSAPATAPV